MVGKVLTFNGITRCEKGTYALVGGEELSGAERDQLLALCRQRLDAFHVRPDQRLGERPGWVCRDPELNSWGWLCPKRSAHQPLSELSLNHLVQLVSQGWNALGNNLPDGVFFQAEVGMHQNIAEASNAPPGQLGVPLTDRWRDLFGRFTQHLQVAEYGVNHHLVRKTVLLGKPLAVSEDLRAAPLHVQEEERPIAATSPFRQEEWPPARSAAAVQGEDRDASPGPPGR